MKSRRSSRRLDRDLSVRLTRPNARQPAHWIASSPRATWVRLAAGFVAILVVGGLYFRHQVVASRSMLARQLEVVADLKVSGNRRLAIRATLGRRTDHARPVRGRTGSRHCCVIRPTNRNAHAVADLAGGHSRSSARPARRAVGSFHARRNWRYPVDDDFLGPVGQFLRGGCLPQKPSHVVRLALGKTQWQTALRSGDSHPIAHRQTSHDDAQDDQAVIAVVLVEIDPYRFLYPDLRRWPSPSPTAECQLLRRDGNRCSRSTTCDMNAMRRYDNRLRSTNPHRWSYVRHVARLGVLQRLGLSSSPRYRAHSRPYRTRVG